ncbi:alpha/beta fold hydrolase [Oligoflexus tunisiensis]|uniref:alpha/beta fold hydrolase n=1 Tax=Oligoflexus tunisiensis TaxID=708132 RepID=UPI00350E40CF
MLFIHSAGSKSEGSGGLINYIADHLDQTFELHAPDMPDPNSPRYAAWKNEIEKNLSLCPGEVILMGHSLGGSVLLKYLAERKVTRTISALFLIAVPYWGTKNWKVDDFILPQDYSAGLASISRLFLYRDQHDEIVPNEHLELYRSDLPRAEVRETAGNGHAFFKGLPELLSDLQKL